MALEYRDFTEATFDAVFSLAKLEWGDGVAIALRKILANPLCRGGLPCGCLASRDGRTVCFKALMRRRVRFGGEEVASSVGGYFVKAEKGCPLPAVLEVQDRTDVVNNGTRFRFGNTCINATLKLNVQGGAKTGPATWAAERFGIVAPLRFAWLLFRRKVLKLEQPAAVDVRGTFAADREYAPGVRRLETIDGRLGDFWKRYLSANRGLVSSRTVEEIDWMFGGEISRGEAMMLALFEDGAVAGYVVLKPMPGSPRRWWIMDLIALGNDERRLARLLDGARAALARDAKAITMEASGFPEWLQPVLAGTMPHVRKLGHNKFIWKTPEKELADQVVEAMRSREGWFFGPYDGDFCF